MCVLQSFVNHIVTSHIKLIFLINPFFHMINKSKQKIKYLENEKSF